MSAASESSTYLRTAEGAPARRKALPGSTVLKWMTTTDHKVIGNLYFITSFVWFMVGGAMALLLRAELYTEGLQIVDNSEQYNQLFTMHGTIMLLLFATPLFAAFANALVPLQIGSPDVAFPRLNMFEYWLYLFGGLIVMSAALTPGGLASFGWTAYAPLSGPDYSPGLGGNLWVVGLALTGFGTIVGSVNFVTTVLCLRAPGMTMFRMPMFTWTVLITSVMVLIAFPVLAAAFMGLIAGPDLRRADRPAGERRRGPVAAPLLVLRAPRGLHHRAAVLRDHQRGRAGLQPQAALRLQDDGLRDDRHRGALDVGVGHHMYATGRVLLPFFAIISMLIAVPTGVKFFNWIGTMWGGKSPSRRR